MKNILASKTIWGGLLLLTSSGLQLAGVEVSPEEQATAVEALTALAGIVLVVWGRWTARDKLTVGKSTAMILAGLLGVIAGLSTFTGCSREGRDQTIGYLGDALQSPLGKQATQIAINASVALLTNQVKELRPYAPAIQLAIANLVYSPSETAERLEDVFRDMPPQLAEVVRYNLLLALRTASESPDGLVGDSGDRYGNQLYAALAK